MDPAVTNGTSAGALLDLIRREGGSSRADIARITGLARSTVSQRVDGLIQLGLVSERGDGPSTGGRPPTRLVFDAAAGVVLAADLGATHCRLAVADLAGSLLGEDSTELDIADGPDAVLAWVIEHALALLERCGLQTDDVRGIGMGLPGPVEFAAGRAVSPPIMPGWDGVPVPPFFAERFPGVPVLVDNDVNVMAVGEHRDRWLGVDDLLYVKVATGIGSGIIAGGHLHRGAQGTAGDLGHVQIPDAGDVTCRCGNTGCVEAVASGRALAARLREKGYDVHGSRDVVALCRGGNPEAVQAVRHAGRLLGEVLASAVNVFNPAVIVIGGDLAEAHEQLFAGVREVVYRRATALATRHLQLVRGRLGEQAGVVGCVHTVLERILSVDAVDAQVADLRRRATA
jgi:predicted NBD/HSP70 family sugar kinase